MPIRRKIKRQHFTFDDLNGIEQRCFNNKKTGKTGSRLQIM